MDVPQLRPTAPVAPRPPVALPTPSSIGDGFAARLAAAAAAPVAPPVGAPAAPGPAATSTVGGGVATEPGRAVAGPPPAGAASAAAGATTLGAMLRSGLVRPGTGLLGTAPLDPSTATATALGQLAGPGHAGHAHGTGAAGTPFAGLPAPVAPVDGVVTSEFGMRVHPVTGEHRHHGGLDVGAPTGTPVRAVTDGTVVSAGDRGGYGLLVEVDHGNGTTTRYAHLSAIDVAVGERLTAGQELGAVGSTGRSTGPHLHLEVRVDGEPVDPHGLW